MQLLAIWILLLVSIYYVLTSTTNYTNLMTKINCKFFLYSLLITYYFDIILYLSVVKCERFQILMYCTKIKAKIFLKIILI